MPKRVLVVEDNADMRSALHSFLDHEGFQVTAVASTEDGIDMVDEREFDIGLIDINLPGKSGFDMIEYIREEGHAMPLIALTARDGISDKLRGFNLGLTDYVVKPLNLKELRARIDAHIKNAGPINQTSEIETDNFKILPQSLEFFAYGQPAELTQLEFRIMHAFMQNNHVLVTQDDLIEHAWHEQKDIVNPPIRIHIANLRKKIGDDDFKIIKTVPGTGYIFHDPVD